MLSQTLDLSQLICGAEPELAGADIRFSLQPFIALLKERISREDTSKINFFKYLLQEFSTYPELSEPIPLANTGKYNKLYELIYTALSPILNDEEEHLWAIAKPVSPCFYYGTSAFYHVLLDNGTDLRNNISLPSKAELERNILKNFYNLILRRFYDFSLDGQPYVIKSTVDAQTHLLTYYRMDVDNRFLTITHRGKLPELTLENAKAYLKEETNSIEVLRELLPPEMFTIEGISIMTLTDVTGEYALESVKTAILEHNQSREGWNSTVLSSALKSLVGTDSIDFGLLPYIRLNQKTLLYSHEGFDSVILQQARKDGIPETEFTALADTFIAHPRRLLFPKISGQDYNAYPMLRLINEAGVQSYALFPLYYNAQLVGGLELYSRDSAAFTGSAMAKIETAFPLMAQLFQNIITDFNNEIMTIVTDKFTGLQPAVQWRFYQEAYDYMKSGNWKRNLPIGEIHFKDVHPFYGAVDIRNSSIERNLMIRKDLYAHFEVLETTLLNLRTRLPGTFEHTLPQHSAWDHKKFEEISDREIMKTDDYLQRQLPPYMNLLKDVHPEVADLIDQYFELTGPDGKIFENRNNYELSMQMINHALNRRLDDFNAELQEIYPCYFEKFRTDGIEFDIYMGQSITPDRPYTEMLLQDFRFRQLRVIAETTRITAALTSHLPIPLETTQLIFVYGKLIDIAFRTDEQRFDVEGSYNIRYQMVKKRIDKAHIKDSSERLTQPGKIAIIYFESAEAQEYMEYIRKLQSVNLLTQSIEYLEVEELQGVEGLKALRVEVALNHNIN